MNYSTLIDTLSISFPVNADILTATDQQDQTAVEMELSQFLHSITGVGYDLKANLGKGRNYFQNSATFEGGFVAWGGNNTVTNSLGVQERKPEKIQVYFDAEGCFSLGYIKGALQTLKDAVYRENGRITRLDIALDFHNGEVTIDQLEWAYHEGKFTKTAKPSANRVSDLDQKTRGDTIYIGKRQNGKMFRAYEKGKQLGSIESPWVRCEVEILGKDREINPEALTNHADAFAQTYPYLGELCEAFNVSQGEREHLIQNTKVKTSKQIEHLFRHASRSYGRLVTLAQDSFEGFGLDRESSDRLIVELLGRAVQDGLPQCLEHREKNLLQDCVRLHSLYTVASAIHA